MVQVHRLGLLADGVQLAKPSFQIRDQIGPVSAQSAFAANEHIIRAGLRRAGQSEPRQFAKPALDSVAHHCVADLLGHRVTYPNRFCVICGLVRQQHEGVAGKPRAFVRGQKICPLGQRHDLFLLGIQGQMARPARLRRELLAALTTTAGDDTATTNSRHPGAETMAAGANDFAWLKSTFHRRSQYRYGPQHRCPAKYEGGL
jgi:hypothetical protein